MTDTSKHTPTPWGSCPSGKVMHGYSQSFAVYADRRPKLGTLICGCFHDIEGGDDAAKANAELIVRAVNAHDGLVKALRAQERADDLAEVRTGNGYEAWQAAEDEAKRLRLAALAKAEGKEGAL